MRKDDLPVNSRQEKPKKPFFSDKEIDILQAFVDGKDFAEITRELFLNEEGLAATNRKLARKVGESLTLDGLHKAIVMGVIDGSINTEDLSTKPKSTMPDIYCQILVHRVQMKNSGQIASEVGLPEWNVITSYGKAAEVFGAQNDCQLIAICTKMAMNRMAKADGKTS